VGIEEKQLDEELKEREQELTHFCKVEEDEKEKEKGERRKRKEKGDRRRGGEVAHSLLHGVSGRLEVVFNIVESVYVSMNLTLQVPRLFVCGRVMRERDTRRLVQRMLMIG
jgi:hypothetical protein